MWDLSCRGSKGSRNRVKEVSRRASRGAAEDVAREHRNFDNGVDRRQVRDHQNRRYANQVSGRNEPGNLRVDDAERELADDVEHPCGNHLIEGILNESLEPTPEEPVELRNNEEWNKHRSQKNTKRRGHHAEGHNDKRQGLRHNRPKPQQGIEERGDWLCNSRRFEIAQHILGVVRDALRVSLADLIRQVRRFIVAFGVVAAALCILLGPVFIPFFIVPQLDWLFWGWLKAFIQYSFYQVVAAGVLYIVSQFTFGIIRAQITGLISPTDLIKISPVLVVMYLAAIYAIIKVPMLTSHIFSGTAGGSAMVIFEKVAAAIGAAA